jgi:predicted transcriptional regulator
MIDRSEILISVKPKYADFIFEGGKTVELRKRRPNIDPGTRIWIYSTAPVAAIRGYAELVQIRSASPCDIWDTVGGQTGISRLEYDKYFESREIAHALILSDIMFMKQALPLETIRTKVRGFHPPQFFCHLNGASTALRLSSRKYQRVMSTLPQLSA